MHIHFFVTKNTSFLKTLLDAWNLEKSTWTIYDVEEYWVSQRSLIGIGGIELIPQFRYIVTNQKIPVEYDHLKLEIVEVICHALPSILSI